MNFRDHTGHMRMFDLDKMVEMVHGNHSNAPPTMIRIERRDFKSERVGYEDERDDCLACRSAAGAAAIPLDRHDSTLGTCVSCSTG